MTATIPANCHESAHYCPQKHLRLDWIGLDFDYLVIQVFRDKVIDCRDIASDGLV